MKRKVVHLASGRNFSSLYSLCGIKILNLPVTISYELVTCKNCKRILKGVK